MNTISKPHLVDLLRIFDRRKMIVPRIRYASVRSKPELIEDLVQHFTTFRVENYVCFVPRKKNSVLPQIQYDLAKRVFEFDGIPQDVPRLSRQKPRFEIRRGKFVLDFSLWTPDPRARDRETVSWHRSQEQGIDSPRANSSQSEPYPGSDSTPR